MYGPCTRIAGHSRPILEHDSKKVRRLRKGYPVEMFGNLNQGWKIFACILPAKRVNLGRFDEVIKKAILLTLSSIFNTILKNLKNLHDEGIISLLREES